MRVFRICRKKSSQDASPGALLDTAQDVSSVILRPDSGDLYVSPGWGHAGQGDVTMSDRGHAMSYAWTEAERQTVADGAAVRRCRA